MREETSPIGSKYPKGSKCAECSDCPPGSKCPEETDFPRDSNWRIRKPLSQEKYLQKVSAKNK